ncbi:hypothetical protein H0H93_016763 [Arthromyces matolae]|nr:hypothetical protein H0H93_016763 [Arthromyces matolae]
MELLGVQLLATQPLGGHPCDGSQTNLLRLKSLSDGSVLAQVAVSLDIGGSPPPSPTSATPTPLRSSSVLPPTTTFASSPSVIATTSFSTSSDASFSSSSDDDRRATVQSTIEPSTTLSFSAVGDPATSISPTSDSTLPTSSPFAAYAPTLLNPEASSTASGMNASSTSTGSGNGMSTATIVGGTAGGIGIVVILAFIAFLLWKKRKAFKDLRSLSGNKKLKSSTPDDESEWFGPPVGTRSPAPADFDIGVRSFQDANSYHHGFTYPSKPFEAHHVASSSVHTITVEDGYIEDDPFARSPAPSSVSKGRRHYKHDAANESISSESGSATGLLPLGLFTFGLSCGVFLTFLPVVASDSPSIAFSIVWIPFPEVGHFDPNPNPVAATSKSSTKALETPTSTSAAGNSTSSTSSSSQSASSSTVAADQETVSNSPSVSMKSPKRHVGAIVGGVIGGISGMTIIIAFWFLHRRRKQPNSSNTSLIGIVREVKTSPTPSLRDEWSSRMEAAMEEAAKQTERARSRAESLIQVPASNGSGLDGSQSPGTLEGRTRYGSPTGAMSFEDRPPMPDISSLKEQAIETPGPVAL